MLGIVAPEPASQIKDNDSLMLVASGCHLKLHCRNSGPEPSKMSLILGTSSTRNRNPRSTT